MMPPFVLISPNLCLQTADSSIRQLFQLNMSSRAYLTIIQEVLYFLAGEDGADESEQMATLLPHITFVFQGIVMIRLVTIGTDGFVFVWKDLQHQVGNVTFPFMRFDCVGYIHIDSSPLALNESENGCCVMCNVHWVMLLI